LAEVTPEGAADGDARLKEAQADAQELLSTIDQTITTLFNAGTPPEHMKPTRDLLVQRAYSALGKADLDLKQYSAAEESLQQALKIEPTNALNLHRLALTLDFQQRYDEALQAADRALANAQNSPEVVRSIQQERDRLQQLAHSSTPPGPRP